jgi:hypothetical protein
MKPGPAPGLVFRSMFHRFEARTESYPARAPGAGTGLSGAPPTETGPTGLGSAGIIFRGVPTTRARILGGGMLEAVNGVCGMLEVVSGVIAFCTEFSCAVTRESWRDILFKSAC